MPVYASVCAAHVKVCKDDPWRQAIAIMETPGIHDVKVFIMCDTGEASPGAIYDYQLIEHAGCMTLHWH
jgi:hypothetical protein